jgi:drug/metabolite transporter (DMT)-like permease
MTDTADPQATVTTSVPASRAWLPPTGILLALAGAFLYSWKPLLVKLLLADGVDVETQLALRMLLSLPFYAAFAAYAYRGRLARGEATDLGVPLVGLTLLGGVLGYYVSPYLDFLGLKMITASFERLLLFTYPTLVALMGWMFFRERITPALLLALALTYAGLAVVFVKDLHSFGPQVVTGTVLVLTCSVTYALYVLLSARPIARMGAPLFTSLSMVSGSALLVGQFGLTHAWTDLLVAWPDFWLALAMAIGATVVPSFLMSEAIARIGPSMASVTGGAGPLMTTLLAVWLLGEPLTAWHVAGMALVIGGVVVLSRGAR